MILSYLRNKNIFYKTKVLIYDDMTIKTDLLKEIAKYVHPTRSDKKIIININKFSTGFKIIPKKYIVHKTRYPTKKEVFRYINQFIGKRVRDKDKPKYDFDDNLRKEILGLDKYNMRRIQFALEDGFLAGEEKVVEEKFNITKMSSYMISFYVAENLPNLRRIKGDLIDADKLKYINDHFYLDFLKLHYPNIGKKRLRYPKKLLEIVKNKKVYK